MGLSDHCKNYKKVKRSKKKILSKLFNINQHPFAPNIMSPFMFVSLNVDYRSTTKCPKTSIYTNFFLTQTLGALDVCLKNSSSLAS